MKTLTFENLVFVIMSTRENISLFARTPFRQETNNLENVLFLVSPQHIFQNEPKLTL